MRFKKSGPNIPDNLITSVSRGDAVFLCGAGVSCRVGLPTFKELTEKVYESIDENIKCKDQSSEAYKRVEYESYKKMEFDRVLGLLEKRKNKSNSQFDLRMTISKILDMSKTYDLKSHVDLLSFSARSKNGNRILTTNFDTLFEKAADYINMEIPNFAVKEIPDPGSSEDFGILHLHGRVKDPVLEIQESKLVLTSSDFGYAYLRDGWISKYIEDRIRTGPLILVGYRAEDTAMRLLLEAIDADRKRFPDLNEIYALDKIDNDSEFIWKSKGIVPILFKNHEEIYKQLSIWAKYNSDPQEYGLKKILKFVQVDILDYSTSYTSSRYKNPKGDFDFIREQFHFFMQDQKIYEILKNNPPLSWMPEFVQKHIKITDPHFINWISNNFNNPNSIIAFSMSTEACIFTAEFANLLIGKLNGCVEINQTLKNCWELLINSILDNQFNDVLSDWFEVKTKLQNGVLNNDVIYNFVNTIQPRLRVNRRFLANLNPNIEDINSPSDLIQVNFHCDPPIDVYKILEIWPEGCAPKDEQNLLIQLESRLETTLKEATIAGVEDNRSDGITDNDILTIERYDLREQQSGFYPIVLTIAVLWRRIYINNKRQGTKFVKKWSESHYRLFRRIALHVVAEECVSVSLAYRVLMNVPISEYFLYSSSNEVQRLIEKRWNNFNSNQRCQIENRIIKGPTKSRFVEKKAERVDEYVFELLSLIKSTGNELRNKSKKHLNVILKKHPQWRKRFGENTRTQFTASIGKVLVGDITQLDNVNDKNLIEHAWNTIGKNEYSKLNPWGELCKHQPFRALNALESCNFDSDHLFDAWNIMLSTKIVNKSQKLDEKILNLLLKIPPKKFDLVAVSVASWLRQINSYVDLSSKFLRIWDRVFNAETCFFEPILENFGGYVNSLNHPIGQLAENFLMFLFNIYNTNRKIEKSHLSRMSKLVNLPNSFGLLAQIQFARYLPIIYQVNPKWTKTNIFPLFNLQNTNSELMWESLSFAKLPGSLKFISDIKELLFEFINSKEKESRIALQFTYWLLNMIIHNNGNSERYPIESPEVRPIVRKFGTETMVYISRRFKNIFENSGEKDNSFKSIIEPVFKELWPRDLDMQNNRTSESLVSVLCVSGQSFSDAASLFLPYIVQDSLEYLPACQELLYSGDKIFKSSPEIMLKILVALVGNGPVRNKNLIKQILNRVKKHNPEIVNSRNFQILLRFLIVP